MQIRDIQRVFTPRTRSVKDVHPLRRAAEGLGAYLDRLSQDDDSVESDLGSRGRNLPRRFKFAFPPGESAQPVEFHLSREEAEALEMLRDVRDLAVDASGMIMQHVEREAAQERLEKIFADLGAIRVEALSLILDGLFEEGDGAAFSLLSVEAARKALAGIEDVIIRFLDAVSAKNGAEAASDAEPRTAHDAAIGAAEQLRDFLLNEGPARAFARFREINRSSVLGLLQ